MYSPRFQSLGPRFDTRARLGTRDNLEQRTKLTGHLRDVELALEDLEQPASVRVPTTPALALPQVASTPFSRTWCQLCLASLSSDFTAKVRQSLFQVNPPTKAVNLANMYPAWVFGFPIKLTDRMGVDFNKKIPLAVDLHATTSCPTTSAPVEFPVHASKPWAGQPESGVDFLICAELAGSRSQKIPFNRRHSDPTRWATKVSLGPKFGVLRDHFLPHKTLKLIP